MSTKQMSRIAILAALAIALRLSLVSLPNIKPITALFFVCLLYLPFFDSWCIMVLTMVGSALLLGGGVVVLWQVVSFTGLFLLWYYLVRPQKSLSLPLQSMVAGCMAFLYGLFISFLSASQYGANPIAYWLNGLSFDLLHAVSTALFYPIIFHIFRRIST